MHYSKKSSFLQTNSSRIAIDLRSLNYTLLTGVNTYCLHFLRELANIKQGNPQLHFIGIGLNKVRQASLEAEFKFLDGLFDQHLSLKNYCRIPLVSNKVLNLGMSLLPFVQQSSISKNITHFDLLFLLQPRPLWRHPHTKQVTIFHDVYSILEPYSTSFISRWLLNNRQNYLNIARNSYKLWSVSFSTAWDLTRLLGIEQDKIKVVYPAKPDLLLLSKNVSEQKQATLPKKYILAISGIEKRKNWHNLLLAHLHLSNNGITDYTLILAGRKVDSKYTHQLEKMIQKLSIPNVQWIIDPSESQKQELLVNCEFVVYPSLYEGFGFPLLEAFEWRKTVVTSRISSMPEIAGKAALYVNPLNYKDLARGMKKLLTDSTFLKQLEGKTSERLKEYSWSETRQSIENLLTEKIA